MKWKYDPAFVKIFGACLVTVYRGRHLVMTADDHSRDYIVRESATRRLVCRFPKKGQCYDYLKKSYKGTKGEGHGNSNALW